MLHLVSITPSIKESCFSEKYNKFFQGNFILFYNRGWNLSKVAPVYATGPVNIIFWKGQRLFSAQLIVNAPGSHWQFRNQQM